MKGKFSKTEMRGLPGGPNEQFTYVTGVFMQDMYHVPMAQEGLENNIISNIKPVRTGFSNYHDVVDKERQEAIDYISSDGYLKLLSKNYKDPKKEQKIRLNRVKSVSVNFKDAIGSKSGYSYGMYYPDSHNIELEHSGYKGIPLEEFNHSSVYGRMSNREKQGIKNAIKSSHEYHADPVEVQNRLMLLKKGMKETGLYDFNKEEFTKDHLLKLNESIKNNPEKYNYQQINSLIQNVKSDNDLIWLINNVAYNDTGELPIAQKGNGENVNNLLQSIYNSPGYRRKLENEILKSKNIDKEQIDEVDREYYSGDKYDVVDLLAERLNRVQTTPVNEITGDETVEGLYGTMSPSFLNKKPDYLDVESIEEGDRLYKEYYSKKQPIKTEIDIYKDNLKNLSDYKYYLTEEKEHSSHIPLVSETPSKGFGSNITPYAASIVDENIIVKNDYLNDPTEAIAKKRATEASLIGKDILKPGEMVDESHFEAILNSDDMSMNIADLLIGVSGVQYKDTPKKTIQHVKKQIKDNPDLYKKSLSRWLNIMNKIAMQDQGQDMYYGQKGLEKYQGNGKSEILVPKEKLDRYLRNTQAKLINDSGIPLYEAYDDALPTPTVRAYNVPTAKEKAKIIARTLRDKSIEAAKNIKDVSPIGAAQRIYEDPSGYLNSTGQFISDVITLNPAPNPDDWMKMLDVAEAAPFVGLGAKGLKLGANSFRKGLFQSKPNWAKWNPDTPKYPELIEEYNAIEKATKEAGTWMKNPDGSPFQGPPELFIQINSSWFKKAFPEGYEEVFRGVSPSNVVKELNPGRGIFAANYDLASKYAIDDEKGIITPFYKFNTSGNLHNDLDAKGGIFKLAHRKSPNSFELNFNENSWTNLPLETKEKLLLENQNEINRILKQYEKLKKTDPKEYFELLREDIRMKNLRKQKELLKNLKENDKNLLKTLRKKLGKTTTTDDFAKYLEDNNLDYIKLNNIADGGLQDGLGDVSIINHKPGNFLKSLQGNVGFFDMNNPNIFKALTAATATGGLLANENNKQQGGALEKYQGDGRSETNDYKNYVYPLGNNTYQATPYALPVAEVWGNPINRGRQLAKDIAGATGYIGENILQALSAPESLAAYMIDKSRGKNTEFMDVLPEVVSYAMGRKHKGQPDVVTSSTSPEWVKNNPGSAFLANFLIPGFPLGKASKVKKTIDDVDKIERYTKNASGFSKYVLEREFKDKYGDYDFSPENKLDFDNISKIDFEKSYTTPKGETFYIDEKTLNKELADLTKNTKNIEKKQYEDIFNSKLDELNKIIEKNRNPNAPPYKVTGLKNGKLTFDVPGYGTKEWRVNVTPGVFKGELKNIPNEQYINKFPGLSMVHANNLYSKVDEFGRDIGNPKRGSATYKSINEYLKLLDLGRVKSGFSGQTSNSFKLWENAIKNNKGMGYYYDPDQVAGMLRKKGGEGYREGAPNYNDSYKVIPSGNITMTEKDGGPLKKGPLLGIDNMGNQQMMFPGYNYQFPGDMVMEIPVAQTGIESKDAMMKNALARNAHIPFVKRLTLSQKDSPSLYLGKDEEGYDMYGSHQLASFGNYVLPNIVQEGTTLKQISKDGNFDEIFEYHKKQGFKNALYFDNPDDAEYFAEENYKRVSPAFQKQKGGEFQRLVNKYTTKGWQSLTDKEKQTYKEMYQQYK